MNGRNSLVRLTGVHVARPWLGRLAGDRGQSLRSLGRAGEPLSPPGRRLALLVVLEMQ